MSDNSARVEKNDDFWPIPKNCPSCKYYTEGVMFMAWWCKWSNTPLDSLNPVIPPASCPYRKFPPDFKAKVIEVIEEYMK